MTHRLIIRCDNLSEVEILNSVDIFDHDLSFIKAYLNYDETWKNPEDNEWPVFFYYNGKVRAGWQNVVPSATDDCCTAHGVIDFLKPSPSSTWEVHAMGDILLLVEELYTDV